MVHLARVTPPSLVSDALVTFDEEMRKSQMMLGIRLSLVCGSGAQAFAFSLAMLLSPSLPHFPYQAWVKRIFSWLS